MEKNFDLERERGWVLLSNLLVVIIFFQCVCSTEEYQIRCSELAGEIKNSQRAVDLCKCGPLNAPALKVCTGQLVIIKAPNYFLIPSV